MKNFLLLITLLITSFSSFAQQDTVVYYKNHVPQTTIEGADYQIIVRKKNKKSSILQRAKFKDGKWKVTRTETIKQKDQNTFHVKYGKKEYLLKTKKIGGGYIIQTFNKQGNLASKGISRSIFPLHHEGQWHYFKKNKLVTINKYKDEVMVNSYIIGKNNERYPRNSYSNADRQASYRGGPKSLMQNIAKNAKYPAICQQNKLQAQVWVMFAINSNGNPSDFHILSETNQYFNQAAIEAVKACTNWKPALKDGKVISLYIVAPINFKLR